MSFNQQCFAKKTRSPTINPILILKKRVFRNVLSLNSVLTWSINQTYKIKFSKRQHKLDYNMKINMFGSSILRAY